MEGHLRPTPPLTTWDHRADGLGGSGPAGPESLSQLVRLSTHGPDPVDVAASLSDAAGFIWLDAGDEPGAGPWSVLLWAPHATLTDPAGWPAAARRLHRPTPLHAAVRPPDPLPFTAGVAGLVGYGAGDAVEAVAAAPGAGPEPDVWLAAYDGALLHHRPTSTWWAVGPPARRHAARALLEAAEPAPAAPPAPPARAWSGTPRPAWEAAATAALDAIAAGEVYQLNLTRAVHVHGVDGAWPTYLRLRSAPRPARGAYLRLPGGVAVLSNSPERLLEVDGGVARTFPIKGTRPRGRSEAEDRALAEELMHSAKELAELTMIVDLCRNDLGRVAAPGTVRVGPRTLTLHANVLHTTQEVAADLAAGVDAWDALAATFPPASVTGAPKISATRHIARLETEPRGAYCGAIGFVSDHGVARWSVAIRTAVVAGDLARYHVGSGLVADSDPAAEWDETVAKGTRLAAALHGGSPVADEG
jgi:para-aminobenzoate synthetase component 1